MYTICTVSTCTVLLEMVMCLDQGEKTDLLYCLELSLWDPIELVGYISSPIIILFNEKCPAGPIWTGDN